MLRALVLLLVLVLATIAIGAIDVQAAGPPTVNGLYHGDADNSSYIEYNTSEYGSKLYVYFDSPTVYVALVVDRSVNDNVFANKKDASAYMQSAGWNGKHTAGQLTNSEYAEFTLRCAEDPLSWTWLQGYGRLDNGVWVSDEEGSGDGTPPPSYNSSSSFAANINTWNDDFLALDPGDRPWDLHYHGTDIEDWRSPFNPSSPDTVIDPVEGYPASGKLGWSDYYQYEWPMVYEWSVDLEDAGCGSNGIYFVSGSSHHSPLKDNGDDEDDNFPIPPTDEQLPFYDLGDLPDTYSTLLASDGPAHQLIIDSVYLGEVDPDMEADGQPPEVPGTNALGDDSTSDGDEDGVSRQVATEWGNGEPVRIDFDVRGPVTATATADVAMWIDWNGDGDFGDLGEFYLYEDHGAPGTVTREIVVPGSDTYTSGASLSVRVRIVSDQADAPGGSFDAGDYGGVAASGEVEDYVWTFAPTAVTLARVEASAGIGWVPYVLTLLLAAAFALSGPRQTPSPSPARS